MFNMASIFKHAVEEFASQAFVYQNIDKQEWVAISGDGQERVAILGEGIVEIHKVEAYPPTTVPLAYNDYIF